MDAVGNADCRADHRQPGEAELADLLDPEEIDRVEVEKIGDLDHDIAQENAREHIGDREHQQRRYDDLRKQKDRACRRFRLCSEASPFPAPLAGEG